MKKYLALALVMVICLSFAACGQKAANLPTGQAAIDSFIEKLTKTDLQENPEFDITVNADFSAAIPDQDKIEGSAELNLAVKTVDKIPNMSADIELDSALLEEQGLATPLNAKVYFDGKKIYYSMMGVKQAVDPKEMGLDIEKLLKGESEQLEGMPSFDLETAKDYIKEVKATKEGKDIKYSITLDGDKITTAAMTLASLSGQQVSTEEMPDFNFNKLNLVYVFDENDNPKTVSFDCDVDITSEGKTGNIAFNCSVAYNHIGSGVELDMSAK